jgi:predicted RNA-binding Zn-ribbon protein involved in translation (DUF1610 family)
VRFVCPQCRQPLGRWQILWFLRLFAFPCPACGVQVAIDEKGRLALVATVMAAVFIGTLTGVLTDSGELAAFAALGVLVLGAYLAGRVGTFGVFRAGP